jgi:hypothetical protein
MAGTRFFNNRLGFLFQAFIENRNRSSNELGAGYMLNGPELGIKNPTLLTGLSLFDINRIKQRYGGTLAADYRFPGGKINFSNFSSSSSSEIINRNESYDLISDEHNYSSTETRSALNVMTNILSYEQDFSFIKIQTIFSHAFSEQRSPDNLTFSFYQSSVGISEADPESSP